MKGFLYGLLAFSIGTLALSMITKYAYYGIVIKPGLIAGVGSLGYLSITIVLLLISINLTLLEILKKK